MMALSIGADDSRCDFLLQKGIDLYDNFPLSSKFVEYQAKMVKDFANSCMRHIKRFTKDEEVCRLLNHDDFVEHLRSDAEVSLGMKLPPVNVASYAALGLPKYMMNFDKKHKTFSLQKTITDTVGFLRPVFGKSITVEVKSLCEEAFVCGDEQQIKQVLLSLIHNAEQAIVDKMGEIVIYIHEVRRVKDEELVPGSTEKGKYIAFSVHDTGKGMDAETFVRVTKPTSPCEDQTSKHLGLFFVKTFVRFHRGCVMVKTTEGVGSTVTVCLPRSLS